MFALALAGLQTDSLWFDEGYTLYIVRDSDRPPEGITETARFVLTSLSNAAARAGAGAHPPLYFLALDGWAMLAGDSVYAVRLLSAWFGMIALAATAALGRWLFGLRAGLLALVILGTASMFVYYSREARMYSLLLALSALATLVYWRWWRVSRLPLRVSVMYGILLAGLAYTHYAGVLILASHGLHLLLTLPRRVWRLVLPGVIALVMFAPWLRWQFNAYGGPAAIPFDDIGTGLAALIFFMTGGYAGLYALAIALNGFHARRDRSRLVLLACWLVVTPALLLVANSVGPALFQVRHAIGILPAGALLVAGGLTSPLSRFTRLPISTLERGIGGEVVQEKWVNFALLILAAIIIYTQLTVYPFVWPPKPPWEAVTRRVVAARDPLEPAITVISQPSPAAYYDRQWGLTGGIALDLAWRWQEPVEMAGYVVNLREAESVWLMMPGTFASTWDAARELLADRHVGFSDGVMTMVYYRFDRGEGDGLRFRFGDWLAFDGGIQHQLYAQPGENLCFSLELTALQTLGDDYAVDFYLTQGYDTIRALATLRPGALAQGEMLPLAPCLPIPAEVPAGPHHLRMRVYNPDTNQPYPVVEGDDVYWGAEIIFALVSVG